MLHAGKRADLTLRKHFTTEDTEQLTFLFQITNNKS